MVRNRQQLSRLFLVSATAALMAAGCAQQTDLGEPAGNRAIGESDTTSTTFRLNTTTTTPLTTTGGNPGLGSVLISPGADIQELVDANPVGTTFVLETGIHRNQQVTPKDENSFIGEPGAVMDGGSSVESAFTGGGANVTIQGLTIQNYITAAQRGVIEGSASGWRIIDNEIHNNGGAGINVGYQTHSWVLIMGNRIHHNDQIGIVLQDTVGARVVDNEIAHNNPNNRYDFGWEAGGTKFLRTTDLYVANNHVHNNHGPGLWTDWNNFRTTYESNIVRDNYGPGIFHEASYDAVIRNNTVTGNAHQFYMGGILVASSSNVEVHGNTLDENYGGIIGLQDDRGSGERGIFHTTNLSVYGNTVTWNRGVHGIHYNSGSDILGTGTIRFDENAYVTGHDRPFRWGSANSNLTWEQWRGHGHDNTSHHN